MNWMLKNSKGHPDGAWTLAVLGFVVVSACIFVSLFDVLTIKSFSLQIVKPDTTLLLGYLATSTGNYLLRRNVKDKLELEHKKVDLQNNVLGE